MLIIFSIIVLLLTIPFLFLDWKVQKKIGNKPWLSPLFLFLSSWYIIIILNPIMCSFSDLESLNEKTWAFIALVMASFSLGHVLSYISINNKIRIIKKDSERKKYIYVVISTSFLAIIGSLILIKDFNLLSYFANSDNLSMENASYASAEKGLGGYLQFFSISAVILLADAGSKNKSYVPCRGLILVGIILLSISTRREMFFIVFLTWLFSYLLYQQHSGGKFFNRKTSIVLVIFFLTSIFIFEILQIYLRKSAYFENALPSNLNLSIIEIFKGGFFDSFSYVVTNFPTLNHYLEMSYSGNLPFEKSLYPFYVIIHSIFNFFGISFSEPFLPNEFVNVGIGYYNTAPFSLYYYFDYGLVYALACTAVVAFLANAIFVRVNRKSIAHFLYPMIAVAIMLSFRQNELLFIRFWWNFLFLILAFFMTAMLKGLMKNEQKKNTIDCI